MDSALKGIDELRDKVDTLIVVPNQRLLDILDKNVSFIDAMKKADDVLAQAVKSISNLITQPGIINVDFADVRSVMDNGGAALMGIGKANGENRAVEAAKMATESPLLEISIDGAKGVLFNVIGGKDLSMAEISSAAEIIKDRVSPDATFIFGASIDPSYEDMEITVIATGFEAEYNASSDFLSGGKQMNAPTQQLEDLMNRRPLSQPTQQQPQQQKQGIFGSFGRTATTQDEEDLDSLPSFLRRKPRNEDSVLNAEDEGGQE